MRLDDLREHVAAIDQALQNMRRLNRERAGITTILERSDNDSQYDHWRKELEFNQEMIIANSSWREFCCSFAQSPLTIAKSVGAGALIGGTASTLVLFVPYFLTLPASEFCEYRYSNVLRNLVASYAVGACVGATWSAIVLSRLIYIKRVYNQVHDMIDLEAQNQLPYADTSISDSAVSSRILTVAGDQSALADLQPTRAFF
jgi:hypothetical protein